MIPHWPDCCNHDRPRDRFLGTVQVNGHPHDVHVYQDNALAAPVPAMHVCIRYGAEGSEYASPGEVRRFVEVWKASSNCPDDYRAAIELVEKWIAAQ